MVDEEIVAAGVKDARVIESLRTTPRHEFVTSNQRSLAYFDMALLMALFGFVSSTALAKFLLRGEVIEP